MRFALKNQKWPKDSRQHLIKSQNTSFTAGPKKPHAERLSNSRSNFDKGSGLKISDSIQSEHYYSNYTENLKLGNPFDESNDSLLRELMDSSEVEEEVEEPMVSNEGSF